MMIGRLLATRSTNDYWWIGVLLDAVATLAGTGARHAKISKLWSCVPSPTQLFSARAGGKQLLRHAAVTKNMWFYPLGLVCTAMIDPAFDISAYGFAAQSIIAP